VGNFWALERRRGLNLESAAQLTTYGTMYLFAGGCGRGQLTRSEHGTDIRPNKPPNRAPTHAHIMSEVGVEKHKKNQKNRNGKNSQGQ
jgi:hypothetical protein